MKKIVSLLLIAVMLVGMTGMLSGCGTNVAPDFVMPEGGFDTESPVTIRFYHQMGANLTKVLEDAIADFNEIYPNITVEHTSYGDYDGVRDQIRTELTVGDQPNLAYCYPDHIALYNISGGVQTLDTLIASEYGFTEEQIADFVPAYYNEGKAFGDGKMYSLPIAKSTEVLYYNKTFFATHNLTVPTTWEEMEAVCRRIREIDPTCIPLGYDSESNWFITMCEQYGSDYTSATGENFLFNNETNHNFIKMFRQWYADKLVTTEALSGGYTSALFTGESDSGTRAYMCIGSTGGATYQQPNQVNGEFEFEVGITTIPQVNPEEPKVISQGPSICILKDTDPQEVLASWLFAKFLTTNVEFQGAYSMSNGYAPVIQSIRENEAYAAFLAKADTANIQAYAVKVAVEQADAYYVSPAFNGSTVARDQVGMLVQKCLQLPADGLDEAVRKAFEDAVAECKYQAGQ